MKEKSNMTIQIIKTKVQVIDQENNKFADSAFYSLEEKLSNEQMDRLLNITRVG
ncbi:MAG: hypothetical protein R2741_02150 [Methanolobus sp.]